MKKRLLWLLLLPVLLIPVHVHMTDGGSEGWHAILWQLDHCHELSDNGFLVGTRVSLLFGLIPVYDDTQEEPMKPEPTEAPAPAETRRDTPEPTADAAPYLVEEESFFSDFVIQKGSVYGADAAELDQVNFFCYLCVQNPGTETLPVVIAGDFSADVEGGLITERELQARILTKETALEQFWNKIEGTVSMMPMAKELILLEPGENRFWVMFSAQHGESDSKQNRLLPPIRIAPVEDFGCVLTVNGKTVVLGQESAELLRLCRDAIAETGSPFPRIGDTGQGPCIWMSFRAGEHIDVNSDSNRYFGDFCVYSNDVCNYSAAPYYDAAWDIAVPAGTYEALAAALTAEP